MGDLQRRGRGSPTLRIAAQMNGILLAEAHPFGLLSRSRGVEHRMGLIDPVQIGVLAFGAQTYIVRHDD